MNTVLSERYVDFSHVGCAESSNLLMNAYIANLLTKSMLNLSNEKTKSEMTTVVVFGGLMVMMTCFFSFVLFDFFKIFVFYIICVPMTTMTTTMQKVTSKIVVDV